MADVLYSGLSPRAAVLLTDILALLPLGGPPAEQADVQAVWDLLRLDAILQSSFGGVSDSVDANNRSLDDNNGFNAVNWQGRVLRDATGVIVVSWATIKTLSSASSVASVDWENRQLVNASGDVVLDWNVNPPQMLHGSGAPTNGPAVPEPPATGAPAIYYDSDSGSPSYGIMWPWDPNLGVWIGA